MHYQTIVTKEDVSRFKPFKNERFTTTPRCLYEIAEFKESILFEVRDNDVLIIQETTEDEKFVYEIDRAYQPPIVPYLVALACYISNCRTFVMGTSTHTVMVHYKESNDHSGKNAPAFIPSYENGKVIMHQSAGVFFIKDDGYYTAVPNEIACNALLKVYNLSLKLIPSKFLIRFEGLHGFVYFPALEVYADPLLREARNRHIPCTTSLDWVGKQIEIDNLLEDFTKPSPH